MAPVILAEVDQAAMRRFGVAEHAGGGAKGGRHVLCTLGGARAEKIELGGNGHGGSGTLGIKREALGSQRMYGVYTVKAQFLDYLFKLF